MKDKIIIWVSALITSAILLAVVYQIGYHNGYNACMDKYEVRMDNLDKELESLLK